MKLNDWLAAFIVMAGVVFLSCNNDRESFSPLVQDITESVYASGVVKASGQYEVFPIAAGTIRKVLALDGDTVKAGTPLFIIDSDISELNSENARLAMEQSRELSGPGSASLKELEVRIALARDKMSNDSLLLVRQQNLWKEQVGTKTDLERRELAFKASQAEYNSAILQYSLLEEDLDKKYQQALNNYRISSKQMDDFTVKSAIQGTVYDILCEPGELVSPQVPLAVIGQTGVFEVELQVDEYDIVKVNSGQRVFITMDSYQDQVFEGKITLLAPIMNPRTRTFTVAAVFNQAPPVLYPNLTVEANILIRVKKNALTIPTSFITGKNKVLLGNKDTATVESGISNMQWTEVVSGLRPGQLIYRP